MIGRVPDQQVTSSEEKDPHPVAANLRRLKMFQNTRAHRFLQAFQVVDRLAPRVRKRPAGFHRLVIDGHPTRHSVGRRDGGLHRSPTP